MPGEPVRGKVPSPIFLRPDCPFVCELPLDRSYSAMHRAKSDGGYFLTLTHPSESLDFELFGDDQEIARQFPFAFDYWSQLELGAAPENILYQGPKKPGTRVLTPFSQPLQIQGGHLFSFALELMTADAYVISSLYSLGKFDSNSVVFQFQMDQNVNDAAAVWLQLIESFHFKTAEERLFDTLPPKPAAIVIPSPYKRIIEFVKAIEPIREPATKFGGDPFWLEEPLWPLSQETERPLLFVGQISLEDAEWPSGQGKVAYLFAAQEAAGASFLAGGNEFAVVIQPGGKYMPAIHQATGPLLHESDSAAPSNSRIIPCEYGVRLLPKTEPDSLEKTSSDFCEAIQEIKIGGSPVCENSEEVLEQLPAGRYRLLLQANEWIVPFSIGFDQRVAYLSIDESCANGYLVLE